MTNMRKLTCALLVVGAMLVGIPAVASAQAYNPIAPTKSHETITLTGDDMTIQDVVDIARHGAKVDLTPEARQRSDDAYELVLEGARQGMPIYGFNRGSGAGREAVIFEGDPLSEENREALLERNFTGWRRHFDRGVGPEVADEEIVRAQMAVMVNQFTHEAVTPAVTQLLLDLLNKRIAPVVSSRGSPGEGNLAMMSNIRAALVGEGEVHLRGRRMPARDALARAGVQPLRASVDSLGVYTGWPYNAHGDGLTALLLNDAKEMLDWGDLTYAMAMNGLNSSITPLTAVPQDLRPYPYQNWQARRLLNLVRDSYLFDFEGLEEETRIIQDPLSFRDYNHRNGAAWQAWDQLRTDLFIELNSSHRNPSILPGSKQSDSWELDTPWVGRYYVEPGEKTEGGYILSSANFNMTTRDNDVQSFVMALAESIAATAQRVLRLEDPFFTVVEPGDVLSPEELSRAAPQGQGYTISDLMAELQVLANPIPAQGNAIQRQVEDMQSFGHQKVERARLAVDAALHLIGQELLSAAYWMNVREAQDPERSFGDAPTAAWEAFRAVIPWQMDPGQRPITTPGNLAVAFMRGTPAAQFMGEDAGGPDVRRDSPPVDGEDESTQPPDDEEVVDNTEEAVGEDGAPRRTTRGHVKKLRRHAQRLERQVRELRRGARERGNHTNRGLGARSRR